jgi:hypothetical protein
MVIRAITPKKEGGRQTSGSPIAPPSPGQANFGAGRQTSGSPIVPPSSGQANFGASWQTSGLPKVSPARVLLQQLQAALARVGRNGLTSEESVEPSSLNFQDVTPVRPRRPEPAWPSDVDSQADATGMEQILKELHRIIASQERLHAEVTAEMQQVGTEVQVWSAELAKTVRTVELNEAELRTQILGTAAGLVHIEQKLQKEVAQMCAKLEMMQNEQEKKKVNEEERLNALVRERVEEFEQQLEEKEVARLQEHRQSLEEWLAERMCREFERQKRSQREFNKKMAEMVDKLKQESETKVTIVLEMCEQVAEQLRMYESQLKIVEQQLGPELDKEKREQVPLQQRPSNFNFGEVIGGVSANAGSSRIATGSLSQSGFFKSDAPEELRHETEKLADNDQDDKVTSWRTQYQREKIEVAADAQEEPTLDAAESQEEPALDLNQSEKNEATADAHMVGSRRSTLLYGDRNEHEMIEGRPVYESTKVSEALADASGGSGTEGGDSGERLHFNFGEVVADDMQSKPSSNFSAKFEKEVSTREMSCVAQDKAKSALTRRAAAREAAAAKEDAILARVGAAVEAALRAGLAERRSASRRVPEFASLPTLRAPGCP